MGKFNTLSKGFLKCLTKRFPLNASIFGSRSGFVCVLMETFLWVWLFMPNAHKSGMRGITQKIHSAGYTRPRWKVFAPVKRGLPAIILKIIQEKGCMQPQV